jgi:hypothetical protein
MTPRQFLTFVVCGCIYTSYGSCHCRRKGATAQSGPHAASAWLAAFPSRSATREGMFPLLSSGVSVYRAGSAAERAYSRQFSQGRFHCQIAILAGPQAPPPCCSHAAYLERHRRSRSDSGARSRTGAWLTIGHPGHRARCSGNISSIAYSIPSSSKPMKFWSPTSAGPHTNPRR